MVAAATTPELKPCPFCGGEPGVTRRMDEDLWTHNVVEWVGVRCTNCDVGFEWPPDADVGAIEEWNTRKGEDAMVTPSRAEGDNFVMGEETIEKIAPKQREPLDSDQRAVLWMTGIISTAVVLVVLSIVGGVVAYQNVNTPEKICADTRDPPEFCRELAKRRPLQ